MKRIKTVEAAALAAELATIARRYGVKDDAGVAGFLLSAAFSASEDAGMSRAEFAELVDLARDFRDAMRAVTGDS